MICPYCGSEDVSYIGMEDGGGDYGNAVTEMWRCGDCGEDFEGDSIEGYDPGLEGVDRPPKRARRKSRGRGAYGRPLPIFRSDDEPPSSGGWPGDDSPF